MILLFWILAWQKIFEFLSESLNILCNSRVCEAIRFMSVLGIRVATSEPGGKSENLKIDHEIITRSNNY